MVQKMKSKVNGRVLEHFANAEETITNADGECSSVQQSMTASECQPSSSNPLKSTNLMAGLQTSSYVEKYCEHER